MRASLIPREGEDYTRAATPNGAPFIGDRPVWDSPVWYTRCAHCSLYAHTSRGLSVKDHNDAIRQHIRNKHPEIVLRRHLDDLAQNWLSAAERTRPNLPNVESLNYENGRADQYEACAEDLLGLLGILFPEKVSE